MRRQLTGVEIASSGRTVKVGPLRKTFNIDKEIKTSIASGDLKRRILERKEQILRQTITDLQLFRRSTGAVFR
jgi:hypothetical protein